MLGNHYFLVNRFHEAIQELEKALSVDKSNLAICRKLIICYIKTAQLDKAMNLFLNFLNKDYSLLKLTRKEINNCPCAEIIYELENSNPYENEEKKLLSLGILWFLLDTENSIMYFSKIKGNKDVDNIIKKIKSKKLIKHAR